MIDANIFRANGKASGGYLQFGLNCLGRSSKSKGIRGPR
jgi:hypothetical protein